MIDVNFFKKKPIKKEDYLKFAWRLLHLGKFTFEDIVLMLDKLKSNISEDELRQYLNNNPITHTVDGIPNQVVAPF